MDWATYLPYLYSYLAVGVYLTSTLIYVSMLTAGQFVSIFHVIVTSIVHTALWPVSLNFLVRDALANSGD